LGDLFPIGVVPVRGVVRGLIEIVF